jgi:hypothetical protein
MLLQPWFDLVGECGNEADHGLPMGPVSCQRVVCRVSCVGCRVSVVFPVSNVQHLVRVSSSRVEPPVASHAQPRLGKAIGEMARFCQRPARRRFDRCFGAFAKQFACQTRCPRPGLGCRRHGAGIRLAAPRIRKRLCFSESPLIPLPDKHLHLHLAGRTAHLVPASCPVVPTAQGQTVDGGGEGPFDNRGAEANLVVACRAPGPAAAVV